MPIELQVVRASEFVRLDARARLDFEASKQALRSLGEACRKRGLDRALLDLRHLPKLPKAQFSPKQLAELVSAFHEAGLSREQRLAVLYRDDAYGGVRTFTFIGRIKGINVQAFTEFEDGLQWLSTGENNEGGVPVRIAREEAPQPPAARGCRIPGREQTMRKRTTKI
jgi:hypothetical protein